MFETGMDPSTYIALLVEMELEMVGVSVVRIAGRLSHHGTLLEAESENEV